MPRINIGIEVKFCDVLEKMARQAEYEASRAQGDDAQVWLNARVKESDHEELLEYLRESCSQLSTRLWQYIKGDSWEGHGDGSVYALQLEMPATWRKDYRDQLETKVGKYCAQYVLHRWLNLGNLNKQAIAQTELADVVILCNKRERPQLWPQASPIATP